MNLPVYLHIHLKNDSPDEILSKLDPEMNMKSPVAFHLESMSREEQRQLIGMIENYFETENISYKFPYPIYIISELESSITGMQLVKKQEELPKFFQQKEGRMNVKETHLALKNRLLHQEIRNVDPAVMRTELARYAMVHRQIYEGEKEYSFYKGLLQKLKTGKKRG